MTTAAGTSTSMHDERVTDPEWHISIPAGWAVWHFNRLAVEGHQWSIILANDTSGDVFLDVSAVDVSHWLWHSSAGREPVRKVVSAGQVTLFIQRTEHKWHGAKLSQARTGTTQVLRVGSFVALGV